MIVISDTTPVISLLKIGRLDLLERLFGEVFIPDAVYAELTADKRFTEEAGAVSDALYIKNCPCIIILQRFVFLPHERKKIFSLLHKG